MRTCCLSDFPLAEANGHGTFYSHSHQSGGVSCGWQVFRRHAPSAYEPSTARAVAMATATSPRFERDRSSPSRSNGTERTYMSPAERQRVQDNERAQQKAQMQKFGALVSSSLHRLTVEQDDSTYSSLRSLRYLCVDSSALLA